MVFVCSMYNFEFLISFCLSHRSLKPGVMESIAKWDAGQTCAGQVTVTLLPLCTICISCFAGIPTYMPVSISSGAVPPLSCATTDRCVLHHILSIYSSSSYLSLKVAYVLSFGLAITCFPFLPPRSK